mmetsp:Transcript_31148/g.52079  ORF Transcript_31148/g.52079 Transcript_31148/m.52079 type:complete len:403 (+) Transcript_31148:87-1295(+)
METTDDLDWEEWNPSQISFVNHMLAGSVAGAVEHVALFPVDTIKTHIQYERKVSINPLETWRITSTIIQEKGLFRLWRGVTAMFVGCIPAHAAYFSIFEACKKISGADKKGHHPVQAAACGAIASFSHDLLITPFDFIKQRMQLGFHANLLDSIKSVVRSEGVSALYVAFPTTLMMNIPFGGIMVAVNESVKKYLNPSENYSIGVSVLAGSIAGAVAAAVTNPLDVIKTRLQTQSLVSANKLGYTTVDTPHSTARLGNSSHSRKKPMLKMVTPTGSVSSLFGTADGAFHTGSVHRDLSPVSNIILGARNSSSSRTTSRTTSRGDGHNNNHNNTGHRSSSSTGGGGRKRVQLKGVMQTVRTILVEDGLRGFMRGIIPRMLVHAPAVAISWTTYEGMKAILVKH